MRTDHTKASYRFHIRGLLAAILVISVGLGIYRYFNPRIPYVVQQLRSTAIEDPHFYSRTDPGVYMSNNVDTWKDEDVMHIHMVTKDLRPLGEIAGRLKNLRLLNLSKSPIDDVTPLAKCSKLEIVSLVNTKVKDISPLSNLKLKSLDLDGSPIADLSPLFGMTSLERLSLQGTNATEAEINQLQKKLPHCEIRDDFFDWTFTYPPEAKMRLRQK